MAINQQITNDLTWVGVQDPQLKVFDIIMETEYGTTYNAYILKGTAKTALIETVKLPFFDAFEKRVEAVLPVDQIDYLIVNHTEPDHAGSIAKLLEVIRTDHRRQSGGAAILKGNRQSGFPLTDSGRRHDAGSGQKDAAVYPWRPICIGRIRWLHWHRKMGFVYL